jgi:hypothetical protein
MQDIPLEHAMIAWNPKRAERLGEPMNDGAIQIVLHPDRDRVGKALMNTSGACDAGWDNLSTDQRLDELLKEGYEIAVRDGVNIKDIHRAFRVIPEYRELHLPEEAA